MVITLDIRIVENMEMDSRSTELIELGQNVKIKQITRELEQIEPEDYFYLKGFENKVGTVREQKESESGIYSYRIEFDDHHFGYFYSEDFIIIT